MNFCDAFDKIDQEYILFALGLNGFIFNTLSLIGLVLSKEIREYKGNIFKYFIIQTICHVLLFFNLAIVYCIESFFSEISPHLLFCHLRKVLDYYILRICLMVSTYCQIASSFNRYRTITNRFKFFDKIPFSIKIILFVYFQLYSVLFLNGTVFLT